MPVSCMLVKILVMRLSKVDFVAREYCGLDRSHASGVAGNTGQIICFVPIVAVVSTCLCFQNLLFATVRTLCAYGGYPCESAKLIVMNKFYLVSF